MCEGHILMHDKDDILYHRLLRLFSNYPVALLKN